jgi:hypothetical protein
MHTLDGAHLLDCPACEHRRGTLVDTLDEIAGVMTAEADAAFPAEQLARQQARILQRIEQGGRLAPVVTFPSGHVRKVSTVPVRPGSRWAGVAAAVAASFVIGLLAEHLAHDLPGRRGAAPASRAGLQSELPGPVPRPLSDDEFLSQIELAVGRGGPLALGPMDALTPHAWDVR